MKDWITELCSSAFMPHGACYLWNPRLIALHAVSDALIAAAYFSIPVILFYFLRRRPDLPLPQIFMLFGAFILACGATHVIEVWTIWQPHYWLAGGVKAVTALVSIGTACAMVRALPRAFEIPSIAALRLQNDRLEASVRARTADLTAANLELREEAGLREQAQAEVGHLAAIVESSEDAIIGLDLAGVVTSWNAGAKKVFGYTREEMLRHPASRLIPPEHQVHETEILGRVRAGETFGHFDTQRVRKDGSRIDVSVTFSVIKDAGGTVVGASKVARDITEQKRIAREVLRLNAELERRVVERTADLQASNEDLGSFSYSVAHDLRAPLRAIDGYSHIVRTEYATGLDAEGQRMLNVVGSEAQRMGRLIDDLLAFSRLGRQEAKATPVDMTELARSTYESIVRPVPPALPVSFVLPDLPPAQGDASLLGQVWFNLLANAVKYSSGQPAPVITVDGWREGEASTYRVRDNGVGFDDRFRAKLFGAFQRLHTEEEFDGTGLGLALVKRIIQRHGGAVGAEGRLGEGATFTFTVPDRRKR